MCPSKAKISVLHPEMTISTELKKPDVLVRGLDKDTYQLIIRPYKPEDANIVSTVIGEEHLMFLLPCFATDLAEGNKLLPENRTCVPITVPEVNVTYYLVCKKENKKRFSPLFTQCGC